MYLEFCFYSDKMRPTDQEVDAIEKILHHSQFPRGGGQATAHRDTLESTDLGHRQREQRALWSRLYSGFPEKEWATLSRQAKQV